MKFDNRHDAESARRDLESVAAAWVDFKGGSSKPGDKAAKRRAKPHK